MSVLLVAADSASTWNAAALTLGFAALASIAIAWLAIVMWVAGDIRRRSDNPTVQAISVLIAAVCFIPGLLLYIAIRPPETRAEWTERAMEMQLFAQQAASTPSCPSCQRRLRDDFIRCPYCAFSLGEQCDGCQRVIAIEWVACAYCGQARGASAVVAVGPMRKTDISQRQPWSPRRSHSLKPVS